MTNACIFFSTNLNNIFFFSTKKKKRNQSLFFCVYVNYTEVEVDIEPLDTSTIRTIRAIRQDTSAPITDYRRKHSRDRKCFGNSVECGISYTRLLKCVSSVLYFEFILFLLCFPSVRFDHFVILFANFFMIFFYKGSGHFSISNSQIIEQNENIFCN